MKMDFSGVWHSMYRYTSSARSGDFTSEYHVRIQRDGNKLIIKSLPNPEKSYIVLRLTLEDHVAVGTWQEFTSPIGAYGGSLYHGGLQLILSKGGDAFVGRYVGYSRNMTVRGGEWEITRFKN